MHEGINFALSICIVGAVVGISMLIRPLFSKLRIPALVGYIIFGLLLNILDGRFHFLSHEIMTALLFLGKAGVIVLLFRVGLESDLGGLIRQLKLAGFVWAGNILASGAAGFFGARFLLGLDLIPTLFVTAAMTATSVGVSVALWNNAGALKTESGRLFLDVAELDDISSIFFMALLFTLVPVIREGAAEGDHPPAALLLGREAGLLILKFILFGGGGYLFSRFAEERITEWYKNLDNLPHRMVLIAGLSFFIASLAGLLGFSLALGGFFAGLMFSRDPDSVKIDGAFEPIYDFFAPFFFLTIGLNLPAESLLTSISMGGILLFVAVAGKLAGGLPVAAVSKWQRAGIFGLSLVPRAEITMIIMQNGMAMGPWAVPDKLYGGMVLVVLATCIAAPLILRPLIRREFAEEKQQ
jgi:Kef-type K+ transport system membrane component KefB